MILNVYLCLIYILSIYCIYVFVCLIYYFILYICFLHIAAFPPHVPRPPPSLCGISSGFSFHFLPGDAFFPVSVFSNVGFGPLPCGRSPPLGVPAASLRSMVCHQKDFVWCRHLLGISIGQSSSLMVGVFVNTAALAKHVWRTMLLY